MRDSAAFVTPDATTGKRLLSRHLENASIFAALYEQVTSTLTLIRSLTLTPTLTPTPTLTLYAQRARRLVPPAVAGAAPTVAPCTPSKRFHFCMACRCACTRSACACTVHGMYSACACACTVPGSTLPGMPSLEVHACMYFFARSGSSLERACDVASVEDVSEKPGAGQTLAKAGAATQALEGASHAGGAQEDAHKATRQRCALR